MELYICMQRRKVMIQLLMDKKGPTFQGVFGKHVGEERSLFELLESFTLIFGNFYICERRIDSASEPTFRRSSNL
ncbi:uncharacterized protein DS421_16g556560 [Arachis hypogaea]|nr:uncharacterized protein DS421_16g556560 [Arachis hypogaea]